MFGGQCTAGSHVSHFPIFAEVTSSITTDKGPPFMVAGLMVLATLLMTASHREIRPSDGTGLRVEGEGRGKVGRA